MLSETIGAIFQVLFFTLIPFLVYYFKKKTTKGFWEYIGLKKSTKKANILAVVTSLLFAGSLLLLAVFSAEFRELVHNPTSTTGKFKELGISTSSLIMLLIIALLKTSLAEEILFRGFIAKRLISLMGYTMGNIVQAILFGLIHTLIFALATKNILFLAIIFIVPSVGAYVTVYLNEKVANGSIVPGWISHAIGNILAYSIIGFLIN